MKMEKENKIEYVKLIKPAFVKTFNQGEPPSGISISIDKDKYFLEYGTVFKLSETCDSKNKIADLKSKPYPLLNKEFYEREIKQFEAINKNSNKEKE